MIFAKTTEANVFFLAELYLWKTKHFLLSHIQWMILIFFLNLQHFLAWHVQIYCNIEREVHVLVAWRFKSEDYVVTWLQS